MTATAAMSTARGGVQFGVQKLTFATAEECEYPAQMCDTMAELARQACHLPDPSAPPRKRKQKTKPAAASAFETAAAGRQPRGRRLPPLVSEHKSVVEVSVPALDHGEALEEQVGRRVETPLTIDGHTFPKGTRILQVDPQYVLGGHCGGINSVGIRCGLASHGLQRSSSSRQPQPHTHFNGQQ